uniref:Uncharacterized protein n=1 Tax=Lepeophtheirus salmonis TaxID=72036 RepID=A0A0K2V4A6_LEPSM
MGNTSQGKRRKWGTQLEKGPEFLGDLKKKIKEDPTKSMNRLFKEFDVDEGENQEACEGGLGVIL